MRRGRALALGGAALGAAAGVAALQPVTVLEVRNALVFRVAVGTPQRLRVRGLEPSLLDLVGPGDRLVMRAAHRPAAATWLAALGGAAR